MNIHAIISILLLLLITLFYKIKGKGQFQATILLFFMLFFDILGRIIEDYNFIAIVISVFIMVFLRNILRKYKLIILCLLIFLSFLLFKLYLNIAFLIITQIFIYLFFVKYKVVRILSIFNKNYKEIFYLSSVILVFLFIMFSSGINNNLVSLTGVGYYNFHFYDQFIIYLVMYFFIILFFLMIINLSVVFYTFLYDFINNFPKAYLLINWYENFLEQKIVHLLNDMLFFTFYIVYSIPLFVFVSFLFIILIPFLILYSVYKSVIFSVSNFKKIFYIDYWVKINHFINEKRVIVKIVLFIYSFSSVYVGGVYMFEYITSDRFISQFLYNFAYTKIPNRCNQSLQNMISKKLSIGNSDLKSIKGLFIDAENLSIILLVKKDYIYILGKCSMKGDTEVFSKIERKE